MSQDSLPFKYEAEKKSTGITSFAGLFLFLDLFGKIKFDQLINEHVTIRRHGQGWTDAQMITSLVLLNLAGGDCVDDIRILEADDGFCKILKKNELHGLKPKKRKSLMKRWRKERERTVPSPSAIFRYLANFNNPEQEELRQQGKAFIPTQNKPLKGLARINQELAAFAGFGKIQSTATLDMDATLVPTSKENALFCYKGYKAYQPLNTWWAEQNTVLYTEFRDGNVPAGFEQLRVLKESLNCLPESVKKIQLRSDTAGYQHELLKYCATGKDERFGVIDFSIGCNVTPEFKKAVMKTPDDEWKPLYKTIGNKRFKTKMEWAEICFVPNAICHSKNGPEYRYIATREALDTIQLQLPGMEQHLDFPFPVINKNYQRYKVSGIVTNMNWDGEELINWYHKRCGKSEEAHSIMKSDLAGGQLPTENFGENSVWWWIMILSFNLNIMLKKLALAKEIVPKRMKALRFTLFNLPGRVIQRSRTLYVRIAQNNPSLQYLVDARKRIMMLQMLPAG